MKLTHVDADAVGYSDYAGGEVSVTAKARYSGETVGFTLSAEEAHALAARIQYAATDAMIESAKDAMRDELRQDSE